MFINNLRHTWALVLAKLDTPMSYELVCRIHAQVGNQIINTPGELRRDNVRISGTDWRPAEVTELSFKMELSEVLLEINATKRAILMMLKIMRAQPFCDGNKRTATLVANHILISNGCGTLSIPVEKLEEFKTLLLHYYETADAEAITEFLYTECIDGLSSDSDDDLHSTNEM